MAVAMNSRSPGRIRRIRLLCCKGFLASPALIAALLLVLTGSTASSKGVPRSGGGAGPPSYGLSQGANIGDGVPTNRRKRDRVPSSARPVPTKGSEDDRKTQRKPAAPPAAAAEKGPQQRQRPRPQRQKQQAQTAAKGATTGAPDEGDGDDEEVESSLGSGFDSDSVELDSFGWSDDGGSDGDGDGWSDEDGDEESDWGRGAAGGPGGGRTVRRSKAAKGGGGGGGAEGDTMMISNLRSRLNVARQRASRMYREAKSLMSSEMEGVVLKATRPDDLPVKPKHLEALMRPTAEMPKEFNVYLPVVRKLWSKMADKEWRVAAKALYILHRFAADGSIEHASNLKESVAVLRTHHDSRRKVNFFDMDTICDVRAPSWSGEDVAPMEDFLRGYADFVLRRTTQFGPAFAELLDTFTMLAGDREVLASVEGLVSAGSKCCLLGEEQEGAVTVAAVLQVAQDIRDVVEVCAAQLDYLAREWQARSGYPEEVDRWYAFLYENVEPVEALIGRVNELAEKHKLSALRPLAAAPLVLKLRDEEVALEKEKQAALEAEQQQQQQQCTLDEGEEQELRPRSKTEPAGTAGVKAAGRQKAAERDGGSSEEEDHATVRRQKGVQAQEESPPPSSPADPVGTVAAAPTKNARPVEGRGTARAQPVSSRSAAAAVQPTSASSGGGVSQEAAIRRPGDGTGTGTGAGTASPPPSTSSSSSAAAAAAAAPHQEDGGSKATSSTQGAGAKRAAGGDGAKRRAPKKKRSPSSAGGGKASGREKRPARSSSRTGVTKRGPSAGVTSAEGGSGSNGSTRREREQRVRGDPSVPEKERSRKSSPRPEKPPRSGFL